jgi:hypothetical protein
MISAQLDVLEPCLRSIVLCYLVGCKQNKGNQFLETKEAQEYNQINRENFHGV